MLMGCQDFMAGGEPLEVELAAAMQSMPFSAVERALAMGADRVFLARLCGAGDVGIAQMTVSADGGRWDPEGADRRLVLAVREQGALVDLVALSSHARDEWALRMGAGALLGWDCWLAAQVGLEKRLRVYATPFDWLAGSGRGICVLDWSAEALGMLRGLSEAVTLQCDAGAGERLRELLRWGGLPRVETARSGVRRAA